MTKITLLLLAVVLLLLPQACNTQHAVQVAPVEIKPIHITIDVNIRVDRAMDDFFSDIDDETEEETGQAPAGK